MSFYWSFDTTATVISGQLACWPIEPGTVRIAAGSSVLTDDGSGSLVGDGFGNIDYDHGFVEIGFNLPAPPSGSEVKANYHPAEGGCADDCGKCATHFILLDIVPGSISGTDWEAETNVWERLFDKIKRDLLPSHVEIFYLTFSESYTVSIGHRFDIIPGDEEPLDSDGLRTIFDDTSW